MQCDLTLTWSALTRTPLTFRLDRYSQACVCTLLYVRHIPHIIAKWYEKISGPVPNFLFSVRLFFRKEIFVFGFWE